MIIAIPSKGRSNTIKSAKLLPSARVYVPEEEEKAYRAYGCACVYPVPGGVKGITKTRNWILEQTEGDRVVFIDDDVKAAGYVSFGPHQSKHIKMTEAEFMREFDILFDLTEQMNYSIWGIATQSAPRSVYPWKPFIFHTYITASCMGILNYKGLRFDETFPVKEDYELCLRCIKNDGGILGARYLYWENSHWTDEGGCRDYRTQDIEKDAIKRLMKMYPGMIHQIKRGGAEYSIELEF